MSIFTEYKKELEQYLRIGESTEHTYRPALKKLIESIKEGIIAINEPKHILCGAPDYKVIIRDNGVDCSLGYIEAKDIGKPLDDEEKSEQIRRYRESLSNFILTDYIEFRLYEDGDHRTTARLGLLSKEGTIKSDQISEKNVAELLTAFVNHRPEKIVKPENLAQRMARLTHMIKDIINNAFILGKASTELNDLRKAFAKVLIPDLDKVEKTQEFADMFAQTLAYGLFAARANHKSSDPFIRRNAAEEIPKTNPFLRKLFNTITGVELKDEPYAGFVEDLVELLNHADIEEILRHFGKKNRDEDPIIHFYETFLAAYDKKLRKLRGVYYTPEPVISYIVNSIDHILKKDFNLKYGLSDNLKIKFEKTDDEGNIVENECHKVLILDPAGGTGSFLYHVIDMIRSRFIQSGNAGMWSGYVREHLLPRIFGFELLMAPYAVAHLKLGMQLAGLDLETDELRNKWAYDFKGNERLNIFLTNTLEEAEKHAEDLFGPLRVISQEASEASKIKTDLPIMVILGNPPYAGHSANEGEWIKDHVKKEYYPKDNIKEKNLKWLLDDYVKFIRWAQWRVEKTGHGILAFITNHSYLDNPTFRQMRKSLLETFDSIYILDMHGNVKKREIAPDGSKDENIFDIQQGVAIGIFIKSGKEKSKPFHIDIYGDRESKYKFLKKATIRDIQCRQLEPVEPFYYFKPIDARLLDEYNKYWEINDIFRSKSVGIVTARDELAIHLTKEEIWETIQEFTRLSTEDARERFNLGNDARDWKVDLAQKDLKTTGIDREKIRAISYRPFDIRYTYYTGHSRGFICMPRPDVMQHMLEEGNLGIVTCRQSISKQWNHVLIANIITESCFISNRTKEIGYLFPLYINLKKGDRETKPDETYNMDARAYNRISNINQEFKNELSGKLSMDFESKRAGDLKKTFGNEDILYYIYSILNSPSYRKRYYELLMGSFPRIPITSNKSLFRNLCNIGSKLIKLHLLKDISTNDLITSFPEIGSDLVEKGYPRYLKPGMKSPETGKTIQSGRIYINKDQYFEGIKPEIWELNIGSYQVLNKWLKYRLGHKLNYEDKIHYQKVIYALTETDRLQKEIDSVIIEWPIQ